MNKHERNFSGGGRRGHSAPVPGGRRYSSRAQSDERPYKRLVGKLTEIHIQGFKSLKDIVLKMGKLNVLIGANGAGKSNALGFFEMLSYMMSGSLQEYISLKGGGDDLLFNGAKETPSIVASLEFDSDTGKTEYSFRLQYAEDRKLIFGEERHRFTARGKRGGNWTSLGVGHYEARIIDRALPPQAQITRKMLRHCDVYQFHDTSGTSPMKRGWDSSAVRFLKASGGNLPSVLHDLGENHAAAYGDIVRYIGEMLPVFKNFDVDLLHGKAILRWQSKGGSDKSFGAHLTSDGTLRLMALITLLCMPEDRQPDVILIDEPELGLHPHAISLIAALIKRAAVKKQMIIATQSPLLLNEFCIDDFIVAEMGEDGGTAFKRLEEKEFLHWLEEFQPGDLWQKNVIGGNPQ